MNVRSLIIAACASLVCGAFAQKTKAPSIDSAIVGSWHVDIDMFTFNGHTWAEERKHAKTISPEVKTAIEQMQKLHLVFRADHTYTASGSPDGVHKGKWSTKGRDVISVRDGQTKQVVSHLEPNGRLRLDLPKATEYLVKDSKAR